MAAKYFDAIPEKTDLLSDIPNIETGTLPKEWRTTHFPSSTLKENIEIVAKMLEEYEIDLKRWSGRIVDYKFSDEAKRLRSFIPVFVDFLDWNGFNLDGEDSYEIGFKGPCFNLIYVLNSSEGISVPLRIGFECFRKSKPVVYERTMGYVFYLDEIVKEYNKGKLPWSEFLNKYTCPLPVINPSSPSPKRKEKEVVFEQKLVKNAKEKQAEDIRISNPSYKEKLALLRAKVKHFVGDSMFNCEELESLLNKVDTLEGLYSEILNKVNISDISSLILSCFAANLSLKELRRLACKIVLKELKIDQLQQVIGFLDSSIFAKVQEKLSYVQKSKPFSPLYNDTTKIRAVLQSVASEDNICEAIFSFDPDIILDKIKLLSTLETPKFKAKLKIPTISLPDNLKTEDIMHEIIAVIEEIVVQLLSSVLISLIKEIFKALCRQCPSSKSNEKHGDVNINDLFKDKVNPKNVGEGMFKDFGADMEEQGGGENLDDIIKNFFDDLSALLLPSEICDLINGRASEEVLSVIKELIISKYPTLMFFADEDKIKDLFIYFGDFLGDDVCDAIIPDIKILEDYCETDNQDARRALLSGKLSPKQIEDQIEDLKRRNEEKIANIIGLIDGNLLKDLLPPVNSSPSCKNGKKQKGIIPYDPPSVKYLNDQVMNSIYNSVNMYFNTDVVGFVYNLINNEKNKTNWSGLDRDSLKNAINANRTKLDDYEDKDTNSLLKDPLGIGESRDPSGKTEIALGIKNILKVPENRIKTNQNLQSLEPIYSFEAWVKEGIPVSFKTFNKKGNVLLANLDIVLQNQERCEETMTSNELLRYDMGKHNLDKATLLDNYTVFINDIQNNIVIKIDEEKELDPKILDLVGKNLVNHDNDISLQQSLFADYMVNIWSSVLEEKSRNIVKNPTSIFYKHFKGEIFHRIFIDCMNFVLREVANSKLFQVQELQKIEFVKQPNNASGIDNCPSSNQTSLLDIEELKEKAKKKYEQAVESCNSVEDGDITPLEKSNIGGMIELYIRLFVIEYMLRGLFVFSRFDIISILDDNVIVKFLVQKINNDLRNQDGDFYKEFLKQVKKYVGKQGSDKEKSELYEENNTGEAQLTYLIKEQIKNIIGKFDSIIGIESSDLYRKFVDQIFVEDVIDSSRLDSYYFVNSGVTRDATSLPFLMGFANGNFKIEKFVKVLSANGIDVNRVETLSEFRQNLGQSGEGEFKLTTPSSPKVFEEGKCGFFGIRLVYVPPIVGEVEKEFSSNKLNYLPFVKQNTRAFTLDNNQAFPIPMIEILSNTKINNSGNGIVDIDEEKEVSLLKEMMIQSNEFNMIFGFIFNLSRILNLSTIYNITLVSSIVENIDHSFDSTKQLIRTIFRSSIPDNDWWKKEDPEIAVLGGNEGLFQERMDNIKTDGPSFNLAAIAAKTIPIIIKGAAAKFDPCYQLLKSMDDAGNTIAGLTWGSIVQVMPMNIFPLVGFGPPIGIWGALALSLELLSGEVRDKKKREAEKKSKEDPNKNECKEEKK